MNEMKKISSSSRGWESLFFLSEAVMIVFFCVGTSFVKKEVTDGNVNDQNAAATAATLAFYPMLMDITVMLFVGFGFLMVFLKTHSWTSVGFNYLIAAWAIQCGIIFQGFWHCAIISEHFERIPVDMKALINADFCAAAILISMGAVLGKTTLPQLFLLVTFETIFYTLNAVILLDLLKVADVGGAITIHMFGAFYGLAASYFFEPKKAIADERCKGGYNS